MLENYYPLVSAVLGNLFAQIAKALVQGLSKRSISPEVIFASGGMPSSHSSTVAALTMAVGLQEGFDSSVFAVSLIFMGVVAYDAMGVRLAAGRHAAALNVIVAELRVLTELAKEKNRPDKGMALIRRFQERIGHSVGEVFAGLAFGASIAFILHRLL